MAEMLGMQRERAEIPGSSSQVPEARGAAAAEHPLSPEMAASLTSHGAASWRAARLIGGALLAGGLLLGLFNVLAVVTAPPVRAVLFLIGFVPCAVIGLAVLLRGRRYQREAARDVAAGAYITEVGPVHVARTRTAAGILTRGHVHALFQPYPGIVTIVNGSVPAGVYPDATVAYSRHGHFVFTLTDARGRVLYHAPSPGLSPDQRPGPTLDPL